MIAALTSLLLFSLTTQAVEQKWRLKEEYQDKNLVMISVSADSQEMPIGLRDTSTATINITCLPEHKALWVHLLWPERMTYSKTIEVRRSIDGFPDKPQQWNASDGQGSIQGFTLDGDDIEGTELMNRLLDSNVASISFRPIGTGREQDAIFQLAGLKDKLKEVTAACPNWSYFSKRPK